MKEDKVTWKDVPMMLLGLFLAVGVPYVVLVASAFMFPAFVLSVWFPIYVLLVASAWFVVYLRFIFDWWVGAR